MSHPQSGSISVFHPSVELTPDIDSIIDPDMTFSFNVSRNCFISFRHVLLDSEEGRDILIKMLKIMGQSYVDKHFSDFKKLLAAKNHN
ncbi:hypothetical protein ABRP92_18905 [Pectobacterium aroidearum]|uniref:hypothetical protein n=1 Tax=Pectobacterium aroidearum TaxID=1201031 RepID=UPI0032EE1F73